MFIVSINMTPFGAKDDIISR